MNLETAALEGCRQVAYQAAPAGKQILYQEPIVAENHVKQTLLLKNDEPTLLALQTKVVVGNNTRTFAIVRPAIIHPGQPLVIGN